MEVRHRTAWPAAVLGFVVGVSCAMDVRAQNVAVPAPNGGARVQSGEVIDRMLAVVAGDLIMMSDVAAALEFGLVPPSGGADVTAVVLSQLIDRSLMLDEVQRYAPPEPNAESVERELQAVRERFLTPEAFQNALARYGIEESSLRQTLRANLRLRAYLAQRFSAVPPSDEDLLRYFAANQERFSRNGESASFETVRADVLQALELDRRQSMVTEWLAGLRRRANVASVYQPAQAPSPAGR
jgi:hypothetical protein